MEAQNQQVEVCTYKLSPCPASERVFALCDVPDLYAVGMKGGKEGEYTDDSGITFQRCGGGRRVVKKKIGG